MARYVDVKPKIHQVPIIYQQQAFHIDIKVQVCI